MTRLLEVRELKTHFSAHGKTAHALDGVSLTLNAKEVLGIKKCLRVVYSL